MPNRAALTVIGAPITGGIGYFSAKVLDRWGVLDGPANRLGDFLKANIDGGDLAWAIGLLAFLVLYGILLWTMWRPSQREPIPALAAQLEVAAEAASPPSKTVEKARLPRGDLIPMKKAAASLYGENRQVMQESAPQIPAWGDPEKALGLTAQVIMGRDGIPIWGVYPPAENLDRIPAEDAAYFGFSGDASEMFDQFDEKRRYINVQIAKSDFERRRSEILADAGLDGPSKLAPPIDKVPLINALDEYEKLLNSGISQLHKVLEPASDSDSMPRRFLAGVQNHSSFLTATRIAAKSVQKRNADALETLDIDIHPLSQAMEAIEEPLKGVVEAKTKGWTDAAMRSRLEPLSAANVALKQAADNLAATIRAKREEFEL